MRTATDLRAPATTHPGRRGPLPVVMCVGMFLILLDVTVVNVALPSISSGLHAGTAGRQWAVAGYTVTVAGLLLGAGTLGDRLRHRRVVLLGLAVFGLASLGCTAAPGIGVLVGCRASQLARRPARGRLRPLVPSPRAARGCSPRPSWRRRCARCRPAGAGWRPAPTPRPDLHAGAAGAAAPTRSARAPRARPGTAAPPQGR